VHSIIDIINSRSIGCDCDAHLVNDPQLDQYGNIILINKIRRLKTPPTEFL